MNEAIPGDDDGQPNNSLDASEMGEPLMLDLLLFTVRPPRQFGRWAAFAE
ncbi:MAG TPA: hypothetical protein VF779_12775 [Pyrinomonadaceae bacterium]